jgi:hypothetical protein
MRELFFNFGTLIVQGKSPHYRKKMFTEIFSALEQGILPDIELLARRFDVAMTKKLGVVKLPPSFWMQDPKINPRADHLLKIALLLGDADRCGLAVSVLAVEVAEQKYDQPLDEIIRSAADELVGIVPADLQKRIADIAGTLIT